MNNKFSSKESLIGFNLWSLYRKYLKELQRAYSAEIKRALPKTKINSWIESSNGFVNQNGKYPGFDYPALEEIYFQIPNHKSCIRLLVPFANTNMVRVELVINKEAGQYYYYPERKGSTGLIFSPPMIKKVVKWLDEGTILFLADPHFTIHNPK